MRTRIVIVSIFLLTISAIVLVAWVWRATNYPVRNAPVAGKKIVAFGDSLVAGVGASYTGGFVRIVSSDIKRPIVNAGANSDTTATALARLDAVLDREQPDLVILLLGGNDATQHMPIEQTIDNLRAIITKIQDRHAAVLLLNMRGNIIGDPYRRALSHLARTTHAAYLPNALDDVWGNEFLMADQSHPNDRGYGIMAMRIARVLKDLLQSK